MEAPTDSELLRSIRAVLQSQDLQAITDPSTSQRLLHEHVGGHEEVEYVAVQRAMLMVNMLRERGWHIPEEVAQRMVTGAMVGMWMEGFLTGAMVKSPPDCMHCGDPLGPLHDTEACPGHDPEGPC